MRPEPDARTTLAELDEGHGHGHDGLSILATIREGTKGFELLGRAVALFESVYAHATQHPGVLHYLIHAFDDAVHAEADLAPARAYAPSAAAVPHAYHMPSHIFTRLGYWDQAAATNEHAWQISNDVVKPAGESRPLHCRIRIVERRADTAARRTVERFHDDELHLEVIAAARQQDVATARATAVQMMERARVEASILSCSRS